MPGVERVVHRRVTERAGDADARELTAVVDRALDADDGVQAQQLDGDGGIGQIDLPARSAAMTSARQRLDIDLEADRRARSPDRPSRITSCMRSTSVQSCSSPNVS